MISIPIAVDDAKVLDRWGCPEIAALLAGTFVGTLLVVTTNAGLLGETVNYNQEIIYIVIILCQLSLAA